MDASLTGVPQKRRRYFLIAQLKGEDGRFLHELEKELSDQPMSVYDYFGDSIDTEYYYAHPRTYKRRSVFSVHEPSATIRRVNRPIPKNYKQHPADKADVKKSVRPLTTKERSHIQTFPESYVFLGSSSQREHMIGNAVPVKLAEYVAKSINRTLKDASVKANKIDLGEPSLVA